MDLSCIIVSYQALNHLKRCLESLSRYWEGRFEFEVWVIDNASEDGSREYLQKSQSQWSWLKIHLLDANVGFAAANNVGMRVAKGRHCLMLNSDAFVVDDSIRQGIAHLEGNPGRFGCGGLMLNLDGSRGISYGRFPSPLLLLAELASGRFSQLRAMVPSEWEKIHTIDFPIGAYFLFRRWMGEALGFLDERYFVYFEESDLAKRAWDRNWGIDYLPACKAVHVGAGSSGGKRSIPILGLFYESWREYLLQHHNPFSVTLVRTLLRLRFRLAWIKSMVTGLEVAQTANSDQLKAIALGFSGKASAHFKRGRLPSAT
jgi:GT2 family glycosyltransferase